MTLSPHQFRLDWFRLANQIRVAQSKQLDESIVDTLVSVPSRRSTPVVFVVDGDISVRESLELLIRAEGWLVDTVVSGQLKKQAGGELGISEITVKAHRGKIMQEMRANSFADLVKVTARLGLPSEPKA